MSMVSAPEKVDEAWEMRPFWKVASLEKVEVAKVVVPEKVLKSERSDEEAAAIV